MGLPPGPGRKHVPERETPVQLLPPTKPSDVDGLSAIQVLTWRGVPVVLAKASIGALMADGTIVDLHVRHAGVEAEFAAEMAAAGIGVAFLERRVVYPLVAERKALRGCLDAIAP
jgi:DNA-binding transcriptional LysR family regulator